jgi:hypothetical protein
LAAASRQRLVSGSAGAVFTAAAALSQRFFFTMGALGEGVPPSSSSAASLELRDGTTRVLRGTRAAPNSQIAVS